MKYFILICLIFLLSGCTLWDSYFLTKFDNNEYYLVTKIRTDSDVILNKCSDNQFVKVKIDELTYNSILLKNYSQYITYNNDTIKMTNDLYNMINDTKQMYNKDVSETYCKLKFNAIIRSSTKIQEVLGSKHK